MLQQIPNKGVNARTIDTFKSKLLGGGVRSNFLRLRLISQIIGIDSNDVSDKIRFLVKGVIYQHLSLLQSAVPFRGRELKIVEKSFDTWTVTIINDNNFTIRDAMEKWMNLINKTSDNVEGRSYSVSTRSIRLSVKQVLNYWITNAPAESADKFLS